jgi:predicted small metal-binding protein
MSETVQWSLACGDVVPGCDAKFTGTTQDEILGKAAPHAAEAHGITEIDADTKAAVIGAMEQVS